MWIIQVEHSVVSLRVVLATEGLESDLNITVAALGEWTGIVVVPEEARIVLALVEAWVHVWYLN